MTINVIQHDHRLRYFRPFYNGAFSTMPKHHFDGQFFLLATVRIYLYIRMKKNTIKIRNSQNNNSKFIFILYIIFIYIYRVSPKKKTSP
jgi:hypothetical protein